MNYNFYVLLFVIFNNIKHICLQKLKSPSNVTFSNVTHSKIFDSPYTSVSSEPHVIRLNDTYNYKKKYSYDNGKITYMRERKHENVLLQYKLSPTKKSIILTHFIRKRGLNPEYVRDNEILLDDDLNYNKGDKIDDTYPIIYPKH
ncbi:hypothetical protein HZS_839, partial [Henneguya salminicola]